jgi:hypothetical protein
MPSGQVLPDGIFGNFWYILVGLVCNANFWYIFLVILDMLWSFGTFCGRLVGIFCGRLVKCVVVWYILWSFGAFFAVLV